ncbi:MULTISPECIES: tRNA pseudouridine(38-40) synthase TruA [16SrI (Aster yellows group)]|uniref:tRNA pseudouridine synthase A n=2 Tax=16SrI (Aster yellows group) TaxID=3042590 RepID=A0A859I9S1_9MOLU|nr:tRNA pseudouridine(38-40) synthase TruA [Chrysanthemum yellows phytoplasma]PWV43820.1 MAG: tRNA pseudouridine(38-40) synthase TruA ['Brassica napus' phytoplasma]QKX95403.1 MAG: tRNA pseudouridine(38-40) synthase [Rapeseed phyllody phytoplasma]
MQHFFYKLILSYDGTCYYGYQKQPQKITVQQTFEKALKKMTHQNIPNFAASRTDKGVHSQGQTLHFQTTFFLKPTHFQKTLNYFLPPDIRVRQMNFATPNFHARYSAKSKIYQYVFSKKPLNAFNHHFQIFADKLDFDKITKALKFIEGTHNFFAFTSETQPKNFFKTIFQAFLKETSHKYILVFHGNGFLKYMIRFLVGSLIEIGKNKLSLEQFQAMLLGNTTKKATLLAPAKALVLKKIFY